MRDEVKNYISFAWLSLAKVPERFSRLCLYPILYPNEVSWIVDRIWGPFTTSRAGCGSRN